MMTRLKPAGTRDTIQTLIKRHGPRDASALAADLGITAMAVRQHLYALRDAGMVESIDEARPVGRPAKLWRLTGAADALFPDRHAELTVELIQSINTTFGDDGMDRLIAVRNRKQTADYRRRIGGVRTLRGKLRRLAAIRSAEGYMAVVEAAASGEFLLIENHCPICAAATACTGICAAELAVFRAVLGPDAVIERIDYIPAGARRCAYRVSPARA